MAKGALVGGFWTNEDSRQNRGWKRLVPMNYAYPGAGRFLRVLGLCTVLELLALPAVSGSISVESDTVIRTLKRPTGAGANDVVLPVYEYLKLDVEQLGLKELSFHAYGWGRVDATDSGYYDRRLSAELLFGYVEYSDAYQDFSVRLGRQHVFEGVANEAVDGVYARTDLGDQFSVSLYGGLPVDTADPAGGQPEGDVIWGGRLAHRFGEYSDIGLSYKTISGGGETIAALLGVDSAFFLPWGVSIFGRSVRNTDDAGWAEHSYEARINAGDFTISPLYEVFKYRQFFGGMASGVGPFHFLANSDDELKVIGANIDWRWSKNWTLGGKAKDYSYVVNESARFASASVSWFGEKLTQAGGEIGYMKGGKAANNYLLLRMFCIIDGLSTMIWADSVGLDVMYTRYDEEIYGKDSSYSISITSEKKLADSLDIRLSVDCSVDPYFDSDVSAMFTVAYRFGAGF